MLWGCSAAHLRVGGVAAHVLGCSPDSGAQLVADEASPVDCGLLPVSAAASAAGAGGDTAFAPSSHCSAF